LTIAVADPVGVVVEAGSAGRPQAAQSTTAAQMAASLTGC
jgi:hypothetical protein